MQSLKKIYAWAQMEVPLSYLDYFYQSLTQVRISVLFDNQDGRHVSVCTCGNSRLVNYPMISFKFRV